MSETHFSAIVWLKMACDLVPENDKMPNDPVELLQKAAVASVSAGAASLEEAEEFLEKAEAVASQVRS